MTQQDQIIDLKKEIEKLKKQVEDINKSFACFESNVQANFNELMSKKHQS